MMAVRRPLVVIALVVGAAVAGSGQAAAPRPAWLEAYREPASRLIGAPSVSAKSTTICDVAAAVGST